MTVTNEIDLFLSTHNADRSTSFNGGGTPFSYLGVDRNIFEAVAGSFYDLKEGRSDFEQIMHVRNAWNARLLRTIHEMDQEGCQSAAAAKAVRNFTNALTCTPYLTSNILRRDSLIKSRGRCKQYKFCPWCWMRKIREKYTMFLAGCNTGVFNLTRFDYDHNRMNADYMAGINWKTQARRALNRKINNRCNKHKRILDFKLITRSHNPARFSSENISESNSLITDRAWLITATKDNELVDMPISFNNDDIVIQGVRPTRLIEANHLISPQMMRELCKFEIFWDYEGKDEVFHRYFRSSDYDRHYL